ncbi:MAG: ribonuclease III [Pseudomonadota bacterium]|nr:ribonuclease III [Pseudomonadota bacterium]|tara:strand:- start:296 stop:949 length:654 start_codon:yes stop_codon:yes gene_type:complete
MTQTLQIINKLFFALPEFQQALIHKSVSQSNNNERLEFLGDAVLEVVISEYLFTAFPELDEGALTQIRASLVNTQSLSEIFLQLDCKDQLKVSKATANLDETHKYSIFAGTLEACIGAVFIGMGWKEAKKFILDIFQSKLNMVKPTDEHKDAKSRLQEKLQAMGVDLPSYNVLANKAGNKFKCHVQFQGQTFSASSPLKKNAEQKVAEIILQDLEHL